MKALSSSIVVLVLAGCGDNQERPDAPVRIDMPADMAVDAGPCGAGVFVTGELVDLDSSNADFHGINNARLTLQGSTAANQTDTTSPNGRFELCGPVGAAPMVFDLVADATASPRYHDGFVVLDPAVVAVPERISLRAFDESRRTPFYISRGLAYDPTKAHVIVQSAVDLTDIELDRTHDEPQRGIVGETDGVVTWDNGNVGDYVLFANVDVTNPTGTVTVNPAVQARTFTVPLAANKLTIVSSGWVLVGP